MRTDRGRLSRRDLREFLLRFVETVLSQYVSASSS